MTDKMVPLTAAMARAQADLQADQSARIQELEGLLERGLNSIDEADAKCPVRRGKSPDRCPKCFASDSQSCGLVTRAEQEFLAELRAAQGVK